MITLGISSGHDASAALFVDGKLTAYCKEERLSRKKQDPGSALRQQCIAEVFRIAGIKPTAVNAVAIDRGRIPARCFVRARSPIRRITRSLINRPLRLLGEMSSLHELDEFQLINSDCIRRTLGLSPQARVMFTNHHYSHALGAFQFTTWEKDALYVVCDAFGDGTAYAAYAFDGKVLHKLGGGDEYIFERRSNYAGSMGIAYSAVTKQLGFRANRHEGKITGLAAFGEPTAGEELRRTFHINSMNDVDSTLAGRDQLVDLIKNLAQKNSPEDMAASIQYALEEVVVEWIQHLRKIFPARYIGMSGGVFANVRLNQKVAELPGVDEIFIFPAMGDEGLSVGNCIDAHIRSAGFESLNRYRLSDVYLGASYSATELVDQAHAGGFWVINSNEPPIRTAQYLASGSVGAIFTKRMEMGPRALGARSILASPAKRSVNDSINKRLGRTEFMPFAPYVRDIDASEVFEIDQRNREACKFMTITTNVRDAYKELIQAAVHVDGTARPQIIERQTNPLYYDILSEFKQTTGIPCLVNTSFNAHEEPIINTPGEALKALKDDRVDFLVTDSALIFRNEAAAQR